MFRQRRPGINRIADGTSNTIMINHIRGGPAVNDMRGTWAFGEPGCSTLANHGVGDSYGPNDTVAARTTWPGATIDRTSPWAAGGERAMVGGTTRSAHSNTVLCRHGRRQVRSFRSRIAQTSGSSSTAATMATSWVDNSFAWMKSCTSPVSTGEVLPFSHHLHPCGLADGTRVFYSGSSFETSAPFADASPSGWRLLLWLPELSSSLSWRAGTVF